MKKVLCAVFGFFSIAVVILICLVVSDMRRCPVCGGHGPADIYDQFLDMEVCEDCFDKSMELSKETLKEETERINEEIKRIKELKSAAESPEKREAVINNIDIELDRSFRKNGYLHTLGYVTNNSANEVESLSLEVLYKDEREGSVLYVDRYSVCGDDGFKPGEQMFIDIATLDEDCVYGYIHVSVIDDFYIVE